MLAHALLSLDEQLSNWFAPHNEHIHLILKAAVTADHLVWGQVSFVRLIGYGALFYLVFFAVLIIWARKSDLEWVWIIPVSFILFQPSYWGTMTWATTALHNFPGLLFALLTVIFWKDCTLGNRLCAFLFLTLALFTNGFGIALLGSLLVWQAYEIFKPLPRDRTLSRWISLAALILGLATWIVFRQSQEINLLRNPVGTLDFAGFLHFFSNFAGSCIHFLGSPWVNLLAVAEVGALLWLLKSDFHRKHPAWTCFILYLFIAALITTVARVDMGPKQGLASRYRIYSTLLVCFLYLGLVRTYGKRWTSNRWAWPTAWGVAFLFYGASLFVNLNNLGKIHDRLEADRMRWSRGEPVHEFPEPHQAARILQEAEEAGIFSTRRSVQESSP